jgi:hypothetical protein
MTTCAEVMKSLAESEATIKEMQELLGEPELTPHQRAEAQAKLAAAEASKPIFLQELQTLGCPPPLEIYGIERTQATQFFLINGKGSGAAPDNSVPRLALRPLNVRVYVAEMWTPRLPNIRRVTGRLRYSQLEPAPQAFPDLSPVNGSIGVGTVQQLDRANADASLNFSVPAWNCGGTVEFTVEIFEQPPVVVAAAIAAAPSTVLSQTWVESFIPVPPLRVHIVLIHYNGPDRNGTGTLDVPAPTAFDVATSFNYIAATYPVGTIEFTACDEIEWNDPLNLPTPEIGWGRLYEKLGEIRDGGDKRDLFVGLVPVGVPSNGLLGLGGDGGLALAYGRDGPVLAQEMGHALGRMHAPCGMPGNPDPNYPTYASYQPASIGEFGVDPSTFTVFDPAMTLDFMSYCAPRWISPYTYLALLNAIQSRWASAARIAELGGATDQEILHLKLSIRGDRVQLRPSFHRPGRLQPKAGMEVPVRIDLLADDGTLLVSRRSHLADATQDPDGPVLDLQEDVPWYPETASIAIVRDGHVIHTLEVEPEAPSLRVDEPKLEKRTATIEWHAEHPDRELAFIVDYSNDDGTSWRTLSPSRTSASLTVDLRRLPGGDRCRFRVLATAGIRTTSATTSPVEVPRKRRHALIASPSEGETVKASEPIVLVGGAYSPDYGLSTPQEVIWTSDVDGVIARGLIATARALSPGPHTIRATVADGEGRSAFAKVHVTAD